MPEDKKYVQPPQAGRSTVQGHMKAAAGGLKGGYEYLAPGYWKRKLIHLVLVIPVNYAIYKYLIFMPYFESLMVTNRTNLEFRAMLPGLLAALLTIVAVYFYPFSLYWYKESFIGRVLTNMMFFGGIMQVIGWILAVLIGGVVIAGVFAPIAGPLILHKCRKENRVIGEEKDFN